MTGSTQDNMLTVGDASVGASAVHRSHQLAGAVSARSGPVLGLEGTSNKTGSAGEGSATPLIDPGTTGPAAAVVVLRDSFDVADGARLQAELDGRMAVRTQVLIVEVGEVHVIGEGELSVLAKAATRLQEEHSGSMVLRNASARLLGQLRLMRLDHMFELEI